MDIRQLRFFLAVVEARSFSRGAELAHIAQPALSTHIARLEENLGVQLFHRNSRGVEITHAGSVLANHAYEIIRHVKQAEYDVKNAAHNTFGEIALGLTPSVAAVLTLPLLEKMGKKWPNLVVRLSEGHSKWLQEWLSAGRLDAAVLVATKQTPGLHVTPLLDETLYLVSPMNRKRKRLSSSIKMKEIQRYPIIVPDRESALHIIVERAAMALGMSLKIAAEINSHANIKKAVAAGLGHAVMSSAGIESELANGSFVAQKIIDPSLVRTIAYATRRDRVMTDHQHKVQETVLELIRHLVKAGEWKATLRSPPFDK